MKENERISKEKNSFFSGRILSEIPEKPHIMGVSGDLAKILHGLTKLRNSAIFINGFNNSVISSDFNVTNSVHKIKNT